MVPAEAARTAASSGVSPSQSDTQSRSRPRDHLSEPAHDRALVRPDLIDAGGEVRGGSEDEEVTGLQHGWILTHEGVKG